MGPEAEGAKLTGRVGRSDGRWLTIKEGKVEGDSLSFSLERDRPDGGVMKYVMAGKLAEGKLAGTTTANIEGRGEIKADWKASRKKKDE